MNNCALYYPTIEFLDYKWLWSAALLWDKIYRIVPSGYQPEDCKNVKILAEGGEIGRAIQPDRYAASVAKEFMKKLESGEWTAAALENDIPAEYARLHTDKVDVQLREMIIAKGGGARYGDWLHVPNDFGALYMTYLANHIAKMNDLQLLSDNAAAWTGSTYFKYGDTVQDFPDNEYEQQLAVLVLRDFLPENILVIPPKAIIRFRKKYRDERRRFVQAIRQSAETISKCNDPSIIEDQIKDLKLEIEASLKDYRKTLQTLNITGLTGITSLSLPIGTNVASYFCKDLDPRILFVISTLGLSLGLVSGLVVLQQQRNKLEKESDYSYLLHLGQEWKDLALYGNNYSYSLCRNMEEFIND